MKITDKMVEIGARAQVAEIRRDSVFMTAWKEMSREEREEELRWFRCGLNAAIRAEKKGRKRRRAGGKGNER